MRRAIRLARRGDPTASPNPLVGAVVVAAGRAVGEGFHRRPGEPHAEKAALAHAGPRSRGATLYVTLEPCRVWGRTEPCVDAIRRSGIRRVVTGALDPHPDARGRGITALRRTGIRVDQGVLEAECRALNVDYETRVKRGRPYVILKLAATMDGKIATASGASRWITGPAARAWVHHLRSGVDAILVGSGTVMRDDPLLTPRHTRLRRWPLRIVADTRLRTSPSARVYTSGPPGRAVLATGDTPPARHRPFLARDVLVWPAPTRDGHVDLARLLQRLGRTGVGRVLLEGGSRLAGSALAQNLVDRLFVFYAPIVVGGEGVPMIAGPGTRKIKDALRVGRRKAHFIGPDLLVECEMETH
ncbi:MAG: bifunctional diaminohydroxyphosphoribosylaminopyrimidine deaminase/5-amino-6-(5-phosphoribosylamino)uracil reductase RibD [Nitrospirae bacterium]|nr:bifunctional diaminohydroxyphosphoribosylaminopyrimidine deaminase/5-amino-6-(5-phosphoribosylamino)uracil reductase RibD [Nitrospirota bacterium]